MPTAILGLVIVAQYVCMCIVVVVVVGCAGMGATSASIFGIN